MPLAEISHVIAKLDYIIHWSIQHHSRMGYFAALYQRTTIEVERAIDADYFDNPEKMIKLDVHFAEYYIRAFENYMRQQPISNAWELAFEKSRDKYLAVIQHLLLGMNAHINLDLAISVANIATPETIDEMKHDFYRINYILSYLVDFMQDRIAEVWGPLKILDKLLGRLDEYFIDYLMSSFRDQAWKMAKKLVMLKPKKQKRLINKLDQKVTNYGRKIGFPIASKFNPLSYAIAMKEQRSIPEIIEILHHADIYTKW